MPFDPNQSVLDIPGGVYHMHPGHLVAYLRIALQALPEDNVSRQWIIKSINEDLDKI